MVGYREKLLNLILKANPEVALNPPMGPSGDRQKYAPLDRAIKQSLNRIKSQAVSADGGRVDYPALAGSAVYQEHRKLVSQLGNFDLRSLPTREEKLAFWINLYNTLVVDAVIQMQVKNSVTESWLGILGFFQKAAYCVGGYRFSLTDIEHGILRTNSGFPYFPGPHFSPSDPRRSAMIEILDPRIHFALNCASKACPPIAVYTPDKIDQQLDLAAATFINADSHLDLKKREISISKIFRWYRVDFGGKDGIVQTLEKYLLIPRGSTSRGVVPGDFRISYHAYDWGLNQLV